MAKSKRAALGRGLGELIPEKPYTEIEKEENINSVNEVDIDDVFANESQPRKYFDKDALLELEKSIHKHGIIQPIIVRKKKKGYEIIAGERRWRASKNIGSKKIPVIIKDVSDAELAQMALVENLQREDLNSIEEASAYKSLMDDYNFTQTELSEIVGHSRSHIANTLRLLNLDQDVQKMIIDDKISAGHGRALLSISDIQERHKIAQLIISNDISVREVEKMSQKLQKSTKLNKKQNNKKDPYITKIENNLQNSLGTKVSIKHSKNKGKLEIEYYGEEDLERILEYFNI